MSPRFAIVPARAVVDERLGSGPLRVLLAIGTHADKNGWCWPKYDTLAGQLGVTRARIAQSVASLVELGYIRKGASNGRGVRLQVVYDLPDDALDEPEEPNFRVKPTETRETLSLGPELNSPTTPLTLNVPLNAPKVKVNPSVEFRSETSTPVEDPATAVFEAWVASTGRSRTVLDSKRRAKVRDRLQEGWTVEDLCLAVTGWKNSPHHRGENERATAYNDFELILRDAAHIERFIEFARNGSGGTVPPGRGRQSTVSAAERVLARMNGAGR